MGFANFQYWELEFSMSFTTGNGVFLYATQGNGDILFKDCMGLGFQDILLMGIISSRVNGNGIS